MAIKKYHNGQWVNVAGRGSSSSSGSGIPPASSECVQSDWSQSDSLAPDYIKNRPFYEEGEWFVVESILEEQTLDMEVSTELGITVCGMSIPDKFIEFNKTYRICIDGNEYIEEPKYSLLSAFDDDTSASLEPSLGECDAIILFLTLGIKGFVPNIPYIIANGTDPAGIGIILFDENPTHTISMAEVQRVSTQETVILDKVFKMGYSEGALSVLTYLDIPEFILGCEYEVQIGNDAYTVVGTEDADGGIMLTESGVFQICYTKDLGIFSFSHEDTSGSYTEDGTYDIPLKVVGKVSGLKRIDNKFLPSGGINSGSTLPEVTSANEGQVLGVKGGQWTNVDAPSSLPTVTEEDNEKVLVVVDGVWTAASIADGDEVEY